MKYCAEIDGLRVVAIVPVVFFHGGFGLSLEESQIAARQSG
jgi:peptidoglycan/LPS O-acetylase OafA/YrhL